MARYVTIGMLTIGEGKRAIAEGIADQGAPGVAQQPGFESVTFFLDEARNVYGAFTVWDSREAAEAGNETLTPLFAAAFGEHLETPIETAIYEVYEPKAM